MTVLGDVSFIIKAGEIIARYPAEGG